MREWGLSEEITRLVLPSSDGSPPTLRLHLRELEWWLNESNFSLLPKFISPDLIKITISTNVPALPHETVEEWGQDLPDEVVPIVRSAIKLFPSSLQVFFVALGSGTQTHLTEDISAFVLERGDGLREFTTNVVLSTQAIVHLIKLPHLRGWITEQRPPEVAELIHHGVPDGAASLLPSLGVLRLQNETALGWFSLFEAAKSRTPPWTVAGDNLPQISFHHPTFLPVDSALISRLLPLASLVDVEIGMGCLLGHCASRITDQDAERLAIALPRLEALSLCEQPCHADTCPTTIRSLLSFSIHCPKLRYLSVHFRTASLRADMLDMLAYVCSQGLHSRPKCVLKELVTGGMHFEMSDYDPVLISIGMLIIFPSLTKFITKYFERSGPVWDRLEILVGLLGQTDTTEELMVCLNGARGPAENGVHAHSVVRLRVPSGLGDERGRV